jgi:hypothetical protein
MSGDRWQRVNDLFHAALEREGAARDTFLRKVCGADEALYAEVVSLIAQRPPPARVSSRGSIDRAGGSARSAARRSTRVFASPRMEPGLRSSGWIRA